MQIFGIFLALIFLAMLLAVLVLPIRAFVRWPMPWRWLALLAPLAVLGDAALILIGTRIDPTSHIVWPLEFAMVTICALAAFTLMATVRVLLPKADRSQRRD